MDLTACKKIGMVKEVKPDKNLINSLTETSSNKLKSHLMLELNDTTASSKITLAYDALRELLEALAISKGYKIYNHECYTAFLKEVIKDTTLGDKFDDFRKLRNSINYYGKKVSANEANPILNEITQLIEKIKHLMETGKSI